MRELHELAGSAGGLRCDDEFIRLEHLRWRVVHFQWLSARYNVLRH